ncbi:MAG TPA: M56 family metallopeptidase [Verrucomicrobiae bacterium]
MSQLIETLNQFGERFGEIAWPMLWQSSLLITVLFVFDLWLRRRLRASVRYALWLVVLVKLILPPTLALPTSPAWWLHPTPAAAQLQPQFKNYTVTDDSTPMPLLPVNALPAYVPPAPVLSLAAWLLLASVTISVGLFAWLLLRWWQISRPAPRAGTSERLIDLTVEAQKIIGRKAGVAVRLTTKAMSPAVCGLFRPVILIPQTLVENFSDQQLRAVLLHELIHLRRCDVWLNFLQSLLQIVYWWHPLVWLANARIRRVREEAVDDAVMLMLADEGETYAPTLLEVAKLALNRPLMSLGLVGILESRSALRQRIERLVDFSPPRRAGLTPVSFLGVLAFTAAAVPMGGAPAPATTKATAGMSVPAVSTPAMVAPHAKQKAEQPQVLFEATFYRVNAVDFQKTVSNLKFVQKESGINSWWLFTPEKFNGLTEGLKSSGLEVIQRPRILTRSGWPAEFYVGNGSNGIGLACLPLVTNNLIELTVKGEIIAGQGKVIADLMTNQFNARVFMENHGGMVMRMENADGSTASNLVLVIGAGIITNNATTSPGILTNPQFNAALQQLKQRSGAGTLKEPEVVTTRVSSHVNVMDPNTHSAVQGKLTEAELQILTHNTTPSVPAGSAVLGRYAIKNLLHQVRLKEIRLDHAPLSVALDILTEAILTNNPDRLTVPFVAGPELDTTTITLTLSNVLAEDVLDTFVMVAEHPPGHPVKYSVEEEGVEFSWKDQKEPAIYTRSFKINPETFIVNLHAITGIRTNFTDTDVALVFKGLEKILGMDWDASKEKSVFYNGNLSTLFVKATLPDFHILEHSIATINCLASQVHISARFVEVPAAIWNFQAKSMGIDYQTNQSDGSVAGVMQDKDFGKAMKTLQLLDGVKTLAEQDVVTTSGRQTQMRTTATMTVITNFAFLETVTNVATNFASVRMITNSSITPQSAQVETGPVFEVIPYILANGHQINLTAIASTTDFLGYNNSTNTKAAFTSSGEKVDLPMISPAFRIQQAVAKVNLLDNQTLVMEPTISAQIQSNNPNYFNVPLIAQLLGNQNKTNPKMKLIVFVTVTIIDSVGNRIIHQDKDPTSNIDRIWPWHMTM